MCGICGPRPFAVHCCRVLKVTEAYHDHGDHHAATAERRSRVVLVLVVLVVASGAIRDESRIGHGPDHANGARVLAGATADRPRRVCVARTLRPASTYASGVENATGF